MARLAEKRLSATERMVEEPLSASKFGDEVDALPFAIEISPIFIGLSVAASETTQFRTAVHSRASSTETR
jgi:hypothetical protein